jgi:hypothetical protein
MVRALKMALRLADGKVPVYVITGALSRDMFGYTGTSPNLLRLRMIIVNLLIRGAICFDFVRDLLKSCKINMNNITFIAA